MRRQLQALVSSTFSPMAAQLGSFALLGRSAAVAGATLPLQTSFANAVRGVRPNDSGSVAGSSKQQRSPGPKSSYARALRTEACSSCRTPSSLRPTAAEFIPAERHTLEAGPSAAFVASWPRPNRAWQLRAHTTTSAVSIPSTGEVVPGCIIEYKKDDKVVLGLVDKPDGKRNWFVQDSSGRRLSVRPQQVALVLPGRGYDAEQLRAIEVEAAAAAADPSLLELAYEVSEAAALYTVPQMAELLFADASPASCYAAHRLLTQDRTLFKQAGRAPPVFQPRPNAEVAVLRAAAAAQAKRAAQLEAWRERVMAARQAALGQKPSAQEWARDPEAAGIQAVMQVALGAAGERELREAEEVIRAAGYSLTAASALQLLQAIGAWGPHEQLSLVRLGVPQHFDPELQELAEAMAAGAAADRDAERRVDLTGHTVLTIDDASTTEIDDGVSVEELGAGRVRVWVHVADPTAWLQPGHDLDLEAARRAKSIYLPTGMIPMFPHALACQTFSLRQGQRCCALSIGVVLDEGGAIAETTVVPAAVVPTRRLTYDHADELLQHAAPQEEPELHQLSQVAELRRQWRAGQGAVEIVMPEADVRVEGADMAAPTVTIAALSQHESASRLMVAEMMILAGEAVGTLGGEAGLALPYRGQAAAPPPEAEEVAAVPGGPCRAVMLRGRMTRSASSTLQPLRHASLGLPAYVQVTSPIRRYTDLLAHWQLKAHLRQEAPPYTAEELAQLVDAANTASRDLAALERTIENYWVAEYFRQAVAAEAGRVWPAVLLAWQKQELGLARVLLPQLGLETVVRINRPAHLGEQLLLQCTMADPAASSFRLEEASPALQHGMADEMQDGHEDLAAPAGLLASRQLIDAAM